MANNVYPFQDKKFVLKKEYVSKDGKSTKTVGQEINIGWLIQQETKKVTVLGKDGKAEMDGDKPKTKLDSPVWVLSRYNKDTSTYNNASIMCHWFVQLMADLAGIQIEKPDLIVQPRVDNAMTTAFLLTIENDNRKFYEIGEANNTNQKVGYPINMAFKRAFDRVVLDSLRLYNAYSDVEAEEFRKDAPEKPKLVSDLDPKQRAVMLPFIELLNKCKSVEDINLLSEEIKETYRESRSKEGFDDAPFLALSDSIRMAREKLSTIK